VGDYLLVFSNFRIVGDLPQRKEDSPMEKHVILFITMARLLLEASKIIVLL
jgi:hypothetical protein